MLNFYEQKMNDESLSEEEREVYRQMYDKMRRQTDEEAKKLRAEIEEQRKRENDALAASEGDEDCAGGGCKI